MTHFTVSDVDRDWFATNPDRSYRLRPITAAELAFDTRRRPPDNSGLVAYAIVKQVRLGLRLCVYFISPPFHRVGNFSDVACETLFEECSQMADIIEALSPVGGR
jgi:hypothetical protein